MAQVLPRDLGVLALGLWVLGVSCRVFLFVVMKAGIQGQALRPKALDSRFRGNDGEALPIPLIVAPAQAGAQVQQLRPTALDSRFRGNDGVFRRVFFFAVMPAQAGIQGHALRRLTWIPAFAGMTGLEGVGRRRNSTETGPS